MTSLLLLKLTMEQVVNWLSW